MWSRFVLPWMAIVAVLWTAPAALAQVETLTEIPIITKGNSAPPAPNTEFQEGYLAGSYGSINLPRTADGFTYVGLYDQFRGGRIGGYFRTHFKVAGFRVDPGINWLSSVTVNGLTFAGSAAMYTFSNGEASWNWSTGPAFYNRGSTIVQPTIIHGAEIAHLNLKFQVLGVDYAPPGARSSVSYGSSAMRGTGTSISNTFVDSVTKTVSVKTGLDFVGIVNGSVTGTTSTTYSQQEESTESLSVSTTTSNSVTVLGPLSSAAGVDHNADIIWVWLNPLVKVAVGPNTVSWTGYAFNAEDDAGEMEVVPLYVSWLKNPSTIPPAVASRLARSWDTSGLGGLTAADYAAILSTNPFATSPSYNPNTDSTRRFDLQAGQTFSYQPPASGTQPITQTLTVATRSTSSQGQSSQHTYSTTYNVDYSTGANVIAELQVDVKVANTLSTTNKWSSMINNETGRTASLSITGPTIADGYTGPTTIQVWRDNVYGSFMFYPLQ